MSNRFGFADLKFNRRIGIWAAIGVGAMFFVAFSWAQVGQAPRSSVPPVYFASGSSELNDNELDKLANVASVMANTHPTLVTITGHTDTCERPQSNGGCVSKEERLKLSIERAESVANEIRNALPETGFVDFYSIPIETNGVADSDLEIPTDEGVPFPRNRRVLIVFN